MPDSAPAPKDRARGEKGTPAPSADLGKGPFVPLDAMRFGVEDDVDAAALTEELLGELDRFNKATEEDPFSNPVLLLSLDLSRRIAQGRLSYSALEQLVQYLTVDGFVERARRLGAYIGETDPGANEKRLEACFRRLAEPRTPEEVGERADHARFEVFRQRLEGEVFGIVITAHPTFSLTGDLMHALSTLAADRDDDGAALGGKGRRALIDLARQTEHRPDSALDLEAEHAMSLQAIGNILDGLRRAYAIALDVARDLYPDRWTELRPRLMTVASWVGYDLDGRSDIGWTETLSKRMKVQRAQLHHYAETVRGLKAAVPSGARDLADVLDLMESRLALAENQIEDEIEVFAAAQPHEPGAQDAVSRISKRMYEGMALRLTDAGALVDMVERAVERASELKPAKGRKAADRDALVRRLLVLRAELANLGLGMAHTHLRVNATQVHNAIRDKIGLVSQPNDPRYRQSYIDRINGLLDEVEPVRINFGSVLSERTSFKQMFMVVAQMLKYTGRTAPIRFLIAECESAVTLLTALYVARLFGVDDRVDLSPLFETEKALEAGSRVIDQLLKNRHYRAYIEKRGRICVQTGYSDAGRFIGQTPANASIERLRLRLIRVMAKHGLEHVQLLIFDTHGESIGRGAHPASLAERLTNIDTPYSRAAMREQAVSFKQEMSFQGGDGYLPFVNRTMAFATVTRLLEHATRPEETVEEDPFYEQDAYIREFFTTVKEFQVSLMEDANYGVLLGGFGVNLLYPSGSRALKRQHEEPIDVEHASARQLRAIPHNAILQQLGLLANSIGGVGAAIAKDPERFRALYQRSPRLRQLMGIAEYGLAVSDPHAMKGYIDVVDPGMWITRASVTDSEAAREDMLRLAAFHEESRLSEHQFRVYRKLHRDVVILRRELAAVGAGAAATEGAGTLISPRCRDSLDLLHAVRLAIIQELFLLAMRTPEFSGRHGVTPERLMTRLLHLEVDSACAVLEEIFPLTEQTLDVSAFGEPADLLPDQAASYRFENENLFRPMEGLYDLVRRISTAVAHRIGFFG